MTIEIDHQGLAESRLVTQFKESVNLIAYIRELLSEANEVEDVNQQLLEERWVDTAIGAQLDVLGVIVGQPRGYTIAPTKDFFGFDTSIGSGTFGTDGNGVGAEFLSLTDTEYGEGEFDDDTYRIMIRAKIRKNRTDCTIEDVIAIVLEGISSSSAVQITGPQISNHFGFLFSVGAGPFDSTPTAVPAAFVLRSLSDPEILGGSAAFKMTFIGFLNTFDKLLLTQTDFTPKPAGVSVTYADSAGDFA